MLAQHRKVHGREELFVADFHRVLGIPGQYREELVQAVGKGLSVQAAKLGNRLKLKDKRTGVPGKVAAVRLVDLVDKKVGVEKIRVVFSSPIRVLSLGEGMDR